MHIAHMIDLLNVGGAQKLLVTFARKARDWKLDLTVISLHDDSQSPIPVELRNTGTPVLSLPGRTLSDRARISRLLRFLRLRNFDLLQTHLTSANILGSLAGILTGIPVVATLHSAGFDPRHYNRFRYSLETWALTYGAEKVVAVGNMVAQAHRKRLGSRDIDVIPSAVMPIPPLSEVERMRIRSAICGDPLRPLLISVGRLAPPKAFPDLLRAFADLRRSRSACILAIAGDGMLHDQLSQMIRELHLEGSAVLLGQRNDVPRLLSAADLYVSSSHWEGLPVSILEAMAAGLPVIATSVGDLQQLVPPQAGVLVPPGDIRALSGAICALLDHDDLRSKMGQAALAYVSEHHGLQPWLEHYMNLYEQVIWRKVTSVVKLNENSRSEVLP